MFVFGLGTGRCGTVSLTQVFGMQINVSSAHESVLCPWEYDETAFQKNLIQMKNRLGSNTTVVEIGFYLLPYVNKMMELHPDTKFICLQRDKKQTVDSYMKKSYRRNHWSNPAMKDDFGGWESHGIWDKCYPTYDLPKRAAIEQYWEDYYEQSRTFEQKYPNNFKIFDMVEVLQNGNHQVAMLLFAGLKDVRPILGVKLNSIADRGPQGRQNASLN